MWFRVSGICGALGVLAGAFGAHALDGIVDAAMIDIWNTGARYHLVHALALLGVALHPAPGRATGPLFLGGTIVFSGSLYLLVLTGAKWLGAITPIGGVALVLAWIGLALSRPQCPR